MLTFLLFLSFSFYQNKYPKKLLFFYSQHLQVPLFSVPLSLFLFHQCFMILLYDQRNLSILNYEQNQKLKRNLKFNFIQINNPYVHKILLRVIILAKLFKLLELCHRIPFKENYQRLSYNKQVNLIDMLYQLARFFLLLYNKDKIGEN